MAEERRRFLGELAAWHAATLIARIPFAGDPPDPAAINPYREREAPTEAGARLARWMTRRRWRGALRTLSGGKWKGGGRGD